MDRMPAHTLKSADAALPKVRFSKWTSLAERSIVSSLGCYMAYTSYHILRRGDHYWDPHV
jgi:hypothetical protein